LLEKDQLHTGVTKQAGIYAGKEGYDIQVKNNTRLKGAVIDSQAEKEKNRLTTGTLTWENIDNKAEYKTKASGITVSTHAVYKLNPLGLGYVPTIPVKGKAGTTTRSAISKGTITITDKENQKQDIEKLNRNTEDSLNKLKEIFDKTKVEERKRLLEELGIVGNRAIHAIASHNGWKDGSAEKAALHGMLGAITGAKSGGSALSGLIAGGANEYAIGYLKKTKGKDWINKHPDTVQNISAAFGGILSKMTGGSGHTGAYISQMGTKWNLEAKDTDDVYVVIYGKTYIGEGRHVVGHSAFIIGNSEDGYTEVGFGPQDFSPEILPDYGDFGPTFDNTYFQGVITEKYYGSISDIKQARLFKLNFDRSDTYNLISMINYYQNNSD